MLFRSRKAKDREKSRERYYLPVCSRLTQKAGAPAGTGPKDLTVMRMKVLWNAGHLFFILKKVKDSFIHMVFSSYIIQYPQEGTGLQVPY